MRLRLLDPSHSPIWEYIVPETGYTITGRGLGGLVVDARKHLESNGFTVPDDLQSLIETQICTRLPDPDCVETEGVRDTSCQHRGTATTRYEECPTCCGNHIKAKIVACAVHGECSQFSKKLAGIKACWDCRERLTVMP